MASTIRTTFCKEVDDLIYEKQANLIRLKKRKVTISEAIESLLKDAYIRKDKPPK